MAFPVVCTSVASRRLPEARLLARAVAAHHPGERLVVLVADDPADGATTRVATGAALRQPVAAGLGARGSADEPFDRLCPADLGIEPRAVHELALCVEGDDLAACLVPALLGRLVRTGRPVVALSPEIVLLAPLDVLADAVAGPKILLVPRALAPAPVDGLDPSPAALVALGAFDPGSVVAAPGAEAFLGWWDATLRTMAATPDAHPAQRQPALDVVPHLFGAAICTDRSVGISDANSYERALTWSAVDGYGTSDATGASGRRDPDSSPVHGAPARTVHLVGYDASVPQLVAGRSMVRPRLLQSANEAFARLCAERAAGLVREHASASDNGRERDDGRDAASAGEVRLADGTLLDERMRRLARRALLASPRADEDSDERSGAGPTGPALPDPFDHAEVEAFYDWLAAPDPSDAVVPTLPRYVGEIYAERRDLQWHFPRVATVDMAHFRDWVASHGLDEAQVPLPLRTALARSAWWAAPTGVVVAAPRTLRMGVVLAGYLRAESGVGEAARLAFDAMRAASVDVVPAILGLTPSRQRHGFTVDAAPLVTVADRKVNVIWTNADQLPGFASIAGPDFFAGRYNVGFWAWETEAMSPEMAASAAMLDELWVPSAFVRDAIVPVVDRPVQVFPHPIVAPSVDPRFEPSSLGIPRGFCFLFTFDFLSSFVRKNPLGVLAAFTSAFAPGEGPVLVLKSVNGDRRIAELEQLRLAARDRADVVVIDGYLGAAERGALIASCDCYVSLHRAEGFGLGLGEAMALGKPVVATGYSGNLEFMDDECALLVPARRIAVGPGAAPYAADDHWGEPDLDVAASHLRSVVDRPDAARELGRVACDRVNARHGRIPAERFVARRLGEIDRMLRKGYVSSAADAVRHML